jgi:hypothetical protein
MSSASAPAESPLPDRCLNCGAELGHPRPRFCGACGQETNLRAPRLGEFLQQFGGAYFATEGALWRTLKLLLLRPGELTVQYLAGRRRHYVLPLRLYLSVSLVALLLVRMLGGADIHIQEDTPGEIAQAQHNLNLNIGGGRAGLRDGVFFCDDLPRWVCRRIQRRVDVDPKNLMREFGELGERFMGNLGGAMFLLLPAFALWLKLAWWRRRLRYTEHLVFALHLHALWFLALALAMTGYAPLLGALAWVVPLHTLLAMRRVYGGRWWWTLARAATAMLAYSLTLALAVAGVALWTLLA